MKITDLNASLIGQLDKREAPEKSKGAGAAAEGGKAPAGDRVELSQTFHALRDLVKQVGDAEEIDAKRVAELRAAVADGSLDTDSEEVAAALIREVAADAVR